MIKTTLKYSAIGSAILIFLTLTGYITSSYKFLEMAWPFIIAIVFLTVYWGVKEIIQKYFPDGIKFFPAVAEGLKITLLIAILHSVSIFIYFKSNTEKLLHYKTYSIRSLKKGMLESKMKNPDQFKGKNIEALVQESFEDFSSFNLAQQNAVYMILLGLIVSLITGMILRKKEEPVAPEIPKK